MAFSEERQAQEGRTDGCPFTMDKAWSKLRNLKLARLEIRQILQKGASSGKSVRATKGRQCCCAGAGEVRLQNRRVSTASRLHHILATPSSGGPIPPKFRSKPGDKIVQKNFVGRRKRFCLPQRHRMIVAFCIKSVAEAGHSRWSPAIHGHQ